MIAIMIAWALIGTIFYFGILLEHRNWDLRDLMQILPCWLVFVVLWPTWLAWWSQAIKRRGYRRG